MNDEPESKKEETFSESISRLEKANAEKRELLKREEELEARKILGGRTDAGIQPPAPVEESPTDYAHRIERGILKPGELK